MGLDEVKNDIINDAEKEASRIINETNKEAETLIKKAQTDLEKIEKEELEKLKDELSVFERKEIALVNLESKKLLFEKKKKIINNVVDTAKKEIVNMSKTNKITLLKKLVKKANNEFEVSIIYCNKTETPIIKSCSKNVEIKNTEMSGGIIAENKEKTMRVDLSYDTLFDEIYENMLQELAQVLF
ncbi:hypothetical protein HOC35_02450 [Candidatus Woesearchaeota archaeon]|jgi:vacuolar-type H+-ATPase subunit E/Vma4|nr:hypothetical protein [Candidatus Woesearchaeota archaeon]